VTPLGGLLFRNNTRALFAIDDAVQKRPKISAGTDQIT
jgi:hypothetical protein